MINRALDILGPDERGHIKIPKLKALSVNTQTKLPPFLVYNDILFICNMKCLHLVKMLTKTGHEFICKCIQVLEKRGKYGVNLSLHHWTLFTQA